MKAEETIKPLSRPAIRIIKINTCTSVIGKSTLTYHIGCDEQKALHFRIYENSGGGYFSFEWVSLKSINEAIAKGPKPTTSYALFTLFQGKSVNTPAFILGAIVTEGLMQRDPENPRCYIEGDAKSFNTEMKALIASDINLQVVEKRKPRSKPEPIVIPKKKRSSKVKNVQA